MTGMQDKEPSNLMRLRDRLKKAGCNLKDIEDLGSEDPNVQLEMLNELCMATKGTPAYLMAQAKAMLIMKELERV